MSSSTRPFWVNLAEELQSIAQCGKTYCKNPYDLERYHQLFDIAARILAEHTADSESIIQTIFAKETGYLTPKLDLRAGVIQNNKILMVQESMDSLWSLPGGWADVNESPSEGITREVFEETGYQVRPIKLTFLCDKHKHAHPAEMPHAYKAFFLCELLGGEAKISHESLAVDWFALDNLPPLSKNRVVSSQIESLFKHHAERDIPTEFD